MNLDSIKKAVKKNPRLECIYMCLKSLKSEEECKKIIGLKRNPYSLSVNHYGTLESDKWIYFINFDEDYRYNGFCSLYRIVLFHLAYAQELIMTPVVIWGKNTLYYDGSLTDSQNVFEYYFSPVSDVNSSDVLSCRRVTVSKGADAKAFGTIDGYEIPEEEIDFAGEIRKKYIILKPEVKKMFWDDMLKIVAGNETLGVHVRATDFNKGFNRHPIVVTPQEYIETTKKAMKEHGFKKVFLATDDDSVIDLFINEFGSSLFFYKDTYRSKNGKAIHYGNNESSREHHKFLLGLEIIKDFYTLGYCAGIIAGNSNVSMCARIIKSSVNEQYQYINIINKGVNHNMKETRSVFDSMLK